MTDIMASLAALEARARGALIADLRAKVEALPGSVLEITREHPNMDQFGPFTYASYMVPPATVTVTVAGPREGVVDRAAVLALLADLA